MTDIELTPSAEPTRTRNPWSARNVAILSVIGIALTFVLFQALTNARVFFLNVDEAIAEQSELGVQRFRMQGTVTTEPGLENDGSLFFDMSYAGETAEVRHIGDAPSTLFECNTPVVVEGRWQEGKFQSELITVKHSEEYEAANPDRVEYDEPRPPGSDC